MSALACAAAVAHAQEPGTQPPAGAEASAPARTGLPIFAELEAAGAVIGEVHVRTLEIFDEEDPRENNWLYRLANKVHFVTDPNVVRRMLLFKSGDRVSAQTMEETERTLRTSRNIREVTVRPVAVREGVVDVEVVTRDTWSFDPGVSVGRSGGENSSRISLKESNLLGTGISASVGLSRNVDRRSSTFQIIDPNFLAPWTNADYSYARSSDGKTSALSIQRPFFSLDSRRSVGGSVNNNDRVESVYVSGVNVGEYRHRQKAAEGSRGWSQGLVGDWTRRHTVGLSYQDNVYSEAPDRAPSGTIPDDLKLVVPYYRFAVIENRFRVYSNLDLIGRPEDTGTGFAASIQIGRSLEMLGSTKEQWVYSSEITKGFDVGSRGLLLTAAGLSGRYAGHSEQQQLTTTARVFLPGENNTNFYASAAADFITAPDIPDPMLLGGDNGLRGYPLRYQSGEKRALLSVEGRKYTDWYPFRLIRVGGAVFYDVGRAWGGQNPNTMNPGWLSNIGIGLRLLSDRSSFGNVLHIDLAFPLNKEPGLSTFQFSVRSKVTL